MAELEEQIKVVAEARQRAAELKNLRELLLEEWTKANRDLLDKLTQTGAEVAEVEAKLRELTLQAYAETGNKAPAPGVGIRERTVLTYDGKVAFDWAKAHKMALKLDTSAFEKIAKISDLDFVAVTTEPIATIATTLEVPE